MSQASPAPPSRPSYKLGAFALVVALILSLGLLGWGLMPSASVRGTFAGPVVRVLVTDPKRGALREGSLGEGTYACGIPAGAREPILLLEGPGGSMVQSGGFSPNADVELPLLTLWQATPRVRREGQELRWDWPPMREGEGLPSPRRYSLLFTYVKADGDGEASLLSREPGLTLPLAELRDLLKDHDVSKPRLVVELRAFDPSDPQGSLWVGSRIEWDLPDR